MRLRVAAYFIACLFAVFFLSPTMPARPNDPQTTLELLRQDRLPDLSGNVTSYNLDTLTPTEDRFLLVAETTTQFTKGNIWAVKWGEAPLGQAVIDRLAVMCNDYIATPDGKASAMKLVLDGEKQQPVYLLRDLAVAARFDLSQYADAWMANISPDGKLVCRLGDEEKRALFLFPDGRMEVRSYPGVFLNWDFPRGRAILREDREVFVMQGSKTLFKTKLSFVPTGAWTFGDGTLMVRSRSIGGDDGPAWRMTFDDKGKVKGEAVFGEWIGFPDLIVNRWEYLEPAPPPLAPPLPPPTVAPPPSTVPPPPPPQGPTTERLPSSVLLSVESGQLIARHVDSLQWIGSAPASNAMQECNGVDSHKRIYTLMSEPPDPKADTTVGFETVYHLPHYVSGVNIKPFPLVNSAEVAKQLNIPSAWIYSMTVSPDGNYLALAVTRSDKEAWRQWWLVQYRIVHPKTIPV